MPNLGLRIARLPELEIFSSGRDSELQMSSRPTPVVVAKQRQGACIPQHFIYYFEGQFTQKVRQNVDNLSRISTLPVSLTDGS